MPQINKIPLEIYDEPLHLKSPVPKFDINPNMTGYSGVPMMFTATLTNNRFQPFQEATLYVSAKIGSRTLYQSEPFVPQTVNPQKYIFHNFSFKCPIQGTVEIFIRAMFRFDNLQHGLTETVKVTINPSLEVILNLHQVRPDNFLNVFVKNLLPFQIQNVAIRQPKEEAVPICDTLESGSTLSTYIQLTKQINGIEISWKLPTIKDCKQSYSVNKINEETPNIIAISFEEIPRMIPVLKPFKVGIRMENKTDRELVGFGEFEREQTIGILGRSDFQLNFGPNESKLVELDLIAHSQGNFLIPPIDFTFQGQDKFRVIPNDGVIIVGYDQE
ncbi:hypothetical protein GPJ56_007635 [Histomonas meleagridis]|uniref:uncharacterized protein n=1 Tax=Histomonas meleagridis TaxID=135588 RepID=UPI00355A5026|nr:hypothetical protein GPJ56_007635 [Histomonas meleagridis]KAH0799450.1 hypothetical protein GO595_007851 [Histomonas meleagridis]